jgi:F-box protein 18 (helicase)
LARLAHVEEATGAIELARANAAPGSASGRRELTHEQLAVVTSEVRDDEVMLVRAFAGTGKTTTLLEYVRRRPDKRFAYLTFNRAVMEEAKSKFPANTKALSFHGLAYRKFGFLFQGKFHRGALRAHHVHEATGLPQSDERNILAIRTLEAFLISPDPEVSEAHVPPRRDLDRTYDSGAVKKRLAEEARRSGGEVPTPARDLVSLATKLWTSMKDKTCLKSKMTDAGYLKLYQLSRPKLHLDFEVLMLDEAQDAAPVMADIVLQQTGCAKILVGDPHQEIYSFMGARDAMRAAVARVDKSKVTERRLSRSFRFGREIAAVANSLLRLKGETAPVLGAAREAGDARTPRRPPPLLERSETRSADETVPLEPSSETIDALCEAVRAETAAGAVKMVANTYAALKAHAPARDPKEKGRYVSRRFERRSQLVVLCRSNASVFEAAEMIHGFPGATLGIVGGTQSLRLEQLMDVYRLATYACEEDLLEISDKYVATFAKKELAFLASGVGGGAPGARSPGNPETSEPAVGRQRDADEARHRGPPGLEPPRHRRRHDQKVRGPETTRERAFPAVDGAQGEGPRVPVRVAVARLRGRRRDSAARRALLRGNERRVRGDGFGGGGFRRDQLALRRGDAREEGALPPGLRGARARRVLLPPQLFASSRTQRRIRRRRTRRSGRPRVRGRAPRARRPRRRGLERGRRG